jgi:fucose 4-O-acetylase-like acetyltransferase
MERSHSLDFIKGVAVLVMIFANTTGYFINLTDYNFVRLIYSFAAPVFLVMTGYFSQMNLLKYNSNKKILIGRAFQILSIGVFIDLICWGTIPFITYDILYLIAFSQIFMIFIDFKYYIFVILLFIGGSFFLPYLISYRFEIDEIQLQSVSFKNLYDANPIKRLFFDGWFPVFPWLAFVLMGAFTFSHRIFFTKYSTHFLFLGLGLFTFTYFTIVDIVYPIRNYYLELWYPLKNISLLIPFSIYFIISGRIGAQFSQPNPIFSFFIILGKNSLFAYILNSFLMAMVVFWGLNQNNYPLYLVVFFTFIILTGVLMMDRFRKNKRWRLTPAFIRYFLGYN